MSSGDPCLSWMSQPCVAMRSAVASPSDEPKKVKVLAQW